MEVNKEYQDALTDLEVKRVLYVLASENFEESAYHNLKAAEARVDALVREAKGERERGEMNVKSMDFNRPLQK